MRKAFAILMAAALILGLVPVAAGTAPITGSCGESVTYTFDEASGTLTLSGTGSTAFYTTGEDIPWEDLRGQILRVVVEEGVTAIGDCAFMDCEILSSVSLPSTLEWIGMSAFERCSSLPGIVIPEGVTVIQWHAFMDCALLAHASLPSTLELIAPGAFACTGLVSVTVPESVTELNAEAFNGCGDLATVTLPAGLTFIDGGVFAGCDSLTTVVYPGTDAEWAAITVGTDNAPLLSASRVTEEPLLWSYDAESATLTVSGPTELPDFTTVSTGGSEWITDAPWAIYRAQAEHLVIGDGVAYVGEDAFNGMAALTGVSFGSGFRAFGLGAFNGCAGLAAVAVSGENPYFSAESNCLIRTVNGELILGGATDAIPEGSVTFIGTEAFRDRMLLTTLTLPEGLTSIGEGAFQGCRNLESVSVPSTLISVDSYAFSGCSALAEVRYNGTQARYEENVTVSSYGNGKYLYAAYTFLSADAGDVNGDGAVTDADAIYLLYHTFYPEEYPITQPCDFTRDGAVTDADAIYLLYYTFYPEEYPLDPNAQPPENKNDENVDWGAWQPLPSP